MIKVFINKLTEMIHDHIYIFSSLYIIALYPFTHLYYFHLSHGNLRPFLGNFFTYFTFFFILVLLTYSLLRFRQVMVKPEIYFILIFVAFLLFCSVIVIYNLQFGGDGVNSSELFTYNAKVLVSYLALFLAGYYYKQGILKHIITGLFILILINFLLFLDWPAMQLFYGSIPGMYQSLSKTALITILFAWVLPKSITIRFVIVVLGAFMLYGIGSRPDFWLFILMMPLMVWLILSEEIAVNLRKVLLFGFIPFIFLAYIVAHGSSRMFAFIRPSADGSFLERMKQFAFGFEQVKNNPFAGDYGGAYVHFDGLGHYMHNFLSIWQDFGLIPFVLFTTLCIFVLYYSLLFLKNNQAKQNRYIQMVVIFCVMAVLQVVVARSFGWSEIALAWGLMCGVFYKECSLVNG